MNICKKQSYTKQYKLIGTSNVKYKEMDQWAQNPITA